MVAKSVLHELQHYLGWPGGLFVTSICFAGRLGWPAAVCPLGSLPGLGAEPSHDCPGGCGPLHMRVITIDAALSMAQPMQANLSSTQEVVGGACQPCLLRLHRRSSPGLSHHHDLYVCFPVQADASGTLEAVKGALSALPQEAVALRFLLASANDMTESDIDLADVSDAMIIGFNMEPSESVIAAAKSRGAALLGCSAACLSSPAYGCCRRQCICYVQYEQHVATLDGAAPSKASQSAAHAHSCMPQLSAALPKSPLSVSCREELKLTPGLQQFKKVLSQ